MMHTQAISLLALRRLHGRLPVPVESAHPTGTAAADNGISPFLAVPDQHALARALQRAIDNTWLTLECLFSRDILAPRLGQPGQEALAELLDSPCFAHLSATPAPFREQVRRELHTARKAGPLATADVEPGSLFRQLACFGRPVDAQAVQELEWYALWQMADDLGRSGFPALQSLFQTRTEEGDSLVVGLVAAFVLDELDGEAPFTDSGPGAVSPELVRWLAQHSEPLEALLDAAQGESPPPTRRRPDEAAVHVRQGLARLRGGDYEQAALEFTRALQADPDNAPAHVHRGDAHRLLGDYEYAAADYTAALQLDPANTLAYLNRGTVYRQRGELDRAIADYTEAIRLNPHNAVAFTSRGLAHAQQGDYDRAVADFSQALRLDPQHAWTYQARGDAYAGKGEYDLAVADYTEALRLNAHFPVALMNRGDAYRQKGEYQRAAADYTEALRLDPGNPRLHTSRGDAYRRLGAYDRALADFSEAVRLDPTNPAVYLNRGQVYQLLQQYDRAVADFSRAEQFDADNPEVYYRRALAYRSQAAYKQAVADLTRAIELNPRDAVAYLNRGTIYSLRRRFAQAVADFTEAIRLDPGSSQAYLERGRAQALQGNLTHCLADCAEVLRLDPTLAVPARMLRGGVLLRLGQLPEAVAEFDGAIDSNPRYAKAYNDRGVALSKMGRLEEAVADFSRALQIDPDYAQALANRGNAYQLLNRHQLALQDFTRALLFNEKYAAAYCTQRGLLHLAQNQFDAALADFTVALRLDPDNATARTWFEEARQLHEQSFELNLLLPPAEEPAHAAAKTQVRLAAPETQEQIEIPGEGPAESGEYEITDKDILSEGSQPAGESEYEAEQRRLRELEEQKQREQTAQLRQRLAEAQRKQEEAKKERQAARRQKSRTPMSPAEAAAFRRRWLVRGLAAACTLLVLWNIWGPLKSLYRDLFPVKLSEMAVEQLAGEYAADAAAADKKFAQRRVILRGKLIIQTDKQRRSRHVYLEVPGQEGDLRRITCDFADPDEAATVSSGKTYRISGLVQHEKGSGLKLQYASLMGEAS